MKDNGALLCYRCHVVAGRRRLSSGEWLLVPEFYYLPDRRMLCKPCFDTVRELKRARIRRLYGEIAELMDL